METREIIYWGFGGIAVLWLITTIIRVLIDRNKEDKK